MPVPHLYDLAARALTPEQHEQVLPWRRTMYPETHNALLAVTNHRLRRVGRLVILLLRAVVAIPRWLIGIPRTEWHTLHELTPTTSTDDLLSRLYRNVQYRFYPFGGLGNAMSIYHNPFRLLNLRGPDARNHYQFTLNQTNRYGTSASRRFPTDRYERIRFHESRHA